MADPLAAPAVKAMEAAAFPSVIPVMVGAAGAAAAAGTNGNAFDSILLPIAFMAFILTEYV